MRECYEPKGMASKEVSESEELLSTTGLSIEALEARNEAACPCFDLQKEVVRIADLHNTLWKISVNLPKQASMARHHISTTMAALSWSVDEKMNIPTYQRFMEDAYEFASIWWEGVLVEKKK